MSEPAALMIQGTGSHVGKSLMVAGLCRALVRRGLKVAPFKPQNMSNNAAVTADGGEIGRAQALQARAARLEPSVHMNPVLLKPESDIGAQVVVQGKRFGTMSAAGYGRQKADLMPAVLESFERIGAGMDMVLVEGAGSPAEINLRAGDIANMGFAEAADLPVILVGDIERGGVIAALVGTSEVLPAKERQRVKGFVINKFRGDVSLFSEGAAAIEARTAWLCLGVIPWCEAASALPAEDVLDLCTMPPKVRSSPRKRGSSHTPETSIGTTLDSGLRGNERVEGMPGNVIIAVPVLSRIANFDDLDPLAGEDDVTVVMVRAGTPIPVEADLIVIPGTKSTIAELGYVREQGWDIDIAAHVRRGGRVLGLCGGYQMLGRKIVDPDGIEGHVGSVEGLGLLDIETVIGGDKQTVPIAGRHIPTGETVSGYEIHLGQTTGPDCARPLIDIGGRCDGAQSADGLVAGTYVHGLFASDGFRRTYLRAMGADPGTARYEASVEAALDGLADHLEQHIAVDRLLDIAGYRPRATTKSKTAKPSSAQAAT